MNPRLLALALFIAANTAVPGQAADETTAESARRFEKSRFMDPYYGISYQVDGLEKRKGKGTLFTGSIAGGARVEIQVGESKQVQTSAERRADTRSVWAKDGVKRKELVEGKDSFAPVRFIEDDPDKGPMHHGYAWYSRGRQVFIVHVKARQKGDATARLVDSALAGLSVKADHEAFRHAAGIGRSTRKDPRSPGIVIQAAARYAQAGTGQNLPLAREAAAAARREADLQAKAGSLSAVTNWELVFYGASVHLGAGEYSEALSFLDQCLPLAKKLSNPRRSEAACHFKLASAYSGLGRLDEAFEELSTALAVGNPSFKEFATEQAKSDPSLANMRADPRWKKLVE